MIKDMKHLLQQYSTELSKVYGKHLKSVILYGSYARGDFTEESDIDILILADIPSNKLTDYREHIDTLCGDLLWEYGIVISAIEKDTETYNRYSHILPFYKNIAKEGIKVA